LPEGKVVVPGTTYLAGSAVFTDTCVRLAPRLAGVALWEAIDMASCNPRRLLGLPECQLVPGAVADLVLFDHGPGQEFQVRGVSSGGQWVKSGLQIADCRLQIANQTGDVG
jgi:N-acetylglucosamine-6-phosphate deacetylase